MCCRRPATRSSRKVPSSRPLGECRGRQQGAAGRDVITWPCAPVARRGCSVRPVVRLAKTTVSSSSCSAWPWLAAARAAAVRAAATCQLPGAPFRPPAPDRRPTSRWVDGQPTADQRPAARLVIGPAADGPAATPNRVSPRPQGRGCLGRAAGPPHQPQPPGRLQWSTDRRERGASRVRTDCPAAAIDTLRWPAAAGRGVPHRVGQPGRRRTGSRRTRPPRDQFRQP
jgi:hypothetical protein